jgi:hypothetical protein
MEPPEVSFVDCDVDTIENRDTGTAMFSRRPSAANLPPVAQGVVQSLISRISGVRQQAGEARINLVFAPAELPAPVLDEAAKQGTPESQIHGVIHRGQVFIVRQNLKSEHDVEEVLMHEVLGHGGAISS